jgi:hypothetical protein
MYPIFSAAALTRLRVPEPEPVTHYKVRQAGTVGGWNAKTQKWRRIDFQKSYEKREMLAPVLDQLALGFQAGALDQINFVDKAFTKGGFAEFIDVLSNYEYRLTDFWWHKIFEPFVEEAGCNEEVAEMLSEVLMND